MQKQMNHTEYPKLLEAKTKAQIDFILRDAHAAIKAMPEGVNVGYYQDEINYACSELFRRAQRVG